MVTIDETEGPMAALDRVVLHYAPELAGQPRTAEAINALLGTTFSPCDEITFETVRQVRDAFEAKREAKGGTVVYYDEEAGEKPPFDGELHWPVKSVQDCSCASCGAKGQYETRGRWHGLPNGWLQSSDFPDGTTRLVCSPPCAEAYDKAWPHYR